MVDAVVPVDPVDPYDDFARESIKLAQSQGAWLMEAFLNEDKFGKYQWDMDQEQKEMVFTFVEQERVVKADIQLAGTFGYRSNTWLWGWANESVDLTLTSEVRHLVVCF